MAEDEEQKGEIEKDAQERAMEDFAHRPPPGRARLVGRADRLAGCLVGLAVGDALGTPLEFLPRDQVRKRFPEGLREMIASSLWNKGQYTDDTQMTLLIAESLLQNEGFVASDVASKVP